jgi:pimeloyl-ACP methyl ester carboxylesterase
VQSRQRSSGAPQPERYRQIIPNADVVLLGDGIGHWPQIEAPDAVLSHLLDHIGRAAAPG